MAGHVANAVKLATEWTYVLGLQKDLCHAHILFVIRVGIPECDEYQVRFKWLSAYLIATDTLLIPDIRNSVKWFPVARIVASVYRK
jgi:hypothetical protein